MDSAILYDRADSSQSAGSLPTMTSTTTSSRRILLVTPISPWDESYGAQQRTANLYNALSKIMPVDVLILEEGSVNTVEKGTRQEIIASLSWKQPALTFYKYDTHRWVDDWCQSNLDWTRYALVVSRYLTPITKINWPAHLRTIVDCDDAIYWYTPNGGMYLGRVTAWLRTKMRSLQTAMAVRRYDHTFYCSRRDLRTFPSQASSILPNVVQVPPMPLAPAPAAGATALIVGSMWYPPNRDGVNWFLKHCWPAIASRCPSLNLRIVGAVSAEDRERWERSLRTVVAGFVEDLVAEYARALFVIAPIQYGGGSCIKFLEASGFGRACVITSHVHSAFRTDFRDGDSVAVAQNAGHMVETCAALFTDEQLRDTLARRAYAIASEVYNVQAFDTAVRDAVLELLPLLNALPAGPCRRLRRTGEASADDPKWL